MAEELMIDKCRRLLEEYKATHTPRIRILSHRFADRHVVKLLNKYLGKALDWDTLKRTFLEEVKKAEEERR